VVDSAGAVTCWGSDAPHTTTAVPANLGTVVQVGVGRLHACALNAAGKVTCWGYDIDGQSTVPANLGTVVQLSVGSEVSCVLNDAGLVTCWGKASSGVVNVFQ